MLRKHIRLLSCLAREINYNDYEIKIPMPIENNILKNILNKQKICVAESPGNICMKCSGTGKIKIKLDFDFIDYINCERCKGTGLI
jgi:DnaJ-class molecular chaperone